MRKSLPPQKHEASVKPTHIPAGTTRAIGHTMMLEHGWSEAQWPCLDTLWTRESNWQVHDPNPASDADGIPQANPAWKMARFGADWRDNPVTQIRWGLWYIQSDYGTPCNALAHSNSYNWY